MRVVRRERGGQMRGWWSRGWLVLFVPVLAVLAAVAPASPAAAAPSGFLIDGFGWGHGVGLSQYGAYGQAKEGRNALQIVHHYFPAARLSPLRDDADLRVNVGRSLTSARLRTVPLAPGGGRWEVAIGSRRVVVAQGAEIALVRSGSTVEVRIGGRSVGSASSVTVTWAGTRKPGAAGRVPTALEIAPSVGSSFRTDRRYRYGWLDVGVADGGLQLVNTVRVHDEYLAGIAEVSASWPAAAQQAQAIAARSYALANTGKVRAACRCNVDDGYGGYYDQTFWGFAREQGPKGGNWAAAVRDTAFGPRYGWALSYAGQPISAFYTSSTGGRTQNSEDVWGGVLPWARSVDDHWSTDPRYNPNGRWATRRVSQASLAAVFGLPDVASVRIVRYVSGAAKEVWATSSGGRSVKLKGSTFRSRLGLRSTYVTSVRPG